MTTFPLRLTEELKALAAAQAEKAGVSLNQYILNQYITTMLAIRVGAQAEAEAFFSARGSRAQRGKAREILSRAGTRKEPRQGDQVVD